MSGSHAPHGIANSALGVRGQPPFAVDHCQRSEGWALVRDPYDDGGFSGGTLERPALKQLLADIEEGLVDVVVVYKIDRLSRSLMDFSKLVEVFDRSGVTFVSVTQSFNTCLLYTSPSPRDRTRSRMPSSA